MPSYYTLIKSAEDDVQSAMDALETLYSRRQDEELDELLHQLAEIRDKLKEVA